MNDPQARHKLRTLCGVLVFQALVSSCSCQTKLVSRPPSNEHDDEYSQAGNRLIDVLWIVDNSCSMADKQDRVANSFLNFISYFAHGGIDYRIGVTTMDIYNDKGALLGTPQIITPPPQTPDPVTAFQRNVHVGTGGNGDDRAFTAMQLALDNQNRITQAILAQLSTCLAACAAGDAACTTDCNNKYRPSFMRPDAFLYVVAVTDGDDDSFGEVWYFDRYLAQVKGIGNNTTVTFSAIIGLPPSVPTVDAGTPPDAGSADASAQPDAGPADAGTSGTDGGSADAGTGYPDAGGSCASVPGIRYTQLAQLTGGIVGDVCAPDFSSNLYNLAYNAAGLQRRFALTAKPDLATMKVTVHYRCDAAPQDIGQPCQNEVVNCPDGGSPESYGLTCEVPQSALDGWTYEAATNTMYFNGPSIPGIRSQVEFHYFSVDTATGG